MRRRGAPVEASARARRARGGPEHLLPHGLVRPRRRRRSPVRRERPEPGHPRGARASASAPPTIAPPRPNIPSGSAPILTALALPPSVSDPQARHITTAEYKPGARHTLTVHTPVAGEFILTASAGAFEDFGQRLDGNLGYGLGLGCAGCCGGRRYNVKKHLTDSHIIWNAPADATSTPTVTFKVTAAAGSRDGFRVNSVTFHANPSLPAPGDASSAPPAPSHLLFPPPHAAPSSTSPAASDVINPKLILHGWIMTIAWGALVPFGVWAARYARAPPDAPPARSATLESIRSGWFRLHWILNTAGLAFAAMGWLLAYLAVDEDMGEDAHFGSTHAWFGAATLALGAYQPLNAYLRPPNPSPQELAAGKSVPRRRWEWVHRLTGVAALIASVGAVTTGCDRAVLWGATRGGKAGKATYVVWLGAVIWITVFLEFARRRERKATGADRATRAQTFVELSEEVGMGDGEGHRESPEEAA